MLIAIQFPLADLRPFIADTIPRLTKPEWSGFGPARAFVRSWGGFTERDRGSLGTVEVWSEEQKTWLKGAFPHWTYDAHYCRGRNALRLPVLGDSSLGPRRPTFAFRRLFSDGNEYVRFEVGIFLKPEAALAAGDVRRLVKDFMQLPTRVAGLQTATARDRLVSQSDRLADLYEKSTSPYGSLGAEPQHQPLVFAGEPSILIEYLNAEILGKLDDWHQLDKSLLGGNNLAYFRESDKASGRKIGVWLLQSGSLLSRNLRLCLFQAHAERAILKRVIAFFKRNDYEQLGNARLEKLRPFLARSKETLLAKSKYGCGLCEIQALLAGFDQVLPAGAVDLLEGELQELAVRIPDATSSPLRRKIVSVAAVLDLVSSALCSDELSALCMAHFGDVYKDFSQGQTNGFRVQLLVDYANRRRELKRVIAEIRKLNPAAYAEYEARIYESPPNA